MIRLRDPIIAAGLIVISVVTSWLVMHDFRAGGARPYFYQSNFEPAVMMACGRGFGQAQPPPPALTEFLRVQRDRFDCAEVASSAVVPLAEAAHASWYYLYGATAAIWRVTGVSWLAVDYLDALLAGATTAMLFGLFRLVTGTGVSALVALLLTLSPANLTELLSVRDYSKAPFVLASVLILATLVLKPLSRKAVWALAAAYGAVVGLGYGFRGDLAIMVPFGAFVVATLLPGSWRPNLLRNVTAAVAVLVAFLIVAFPILRGLDKGGCQFHVALLGLTTPLTHELALTSPLYRFGDSLTDTFSILKTGDYATRVLGAPVPGYCDAQYDRASGQLYMEMAATFPADFLVRAYGSVLSVLRWGGEIPRMAQPAPLLASTPAPMVYAVLYTITAVLAPLGPLITLLAIATTFAASIRLGLALTVFVLFLGGYPAIQFEARHWFHLRFIPWWSAVVVISVLLNRRARPWDSRAVMTGVGALAGVLLLMGGMLMTARLVQARSATALFAQYEALAVEPLVISTSGSSMVEVAWQPAMIGPSFDQRGADLIVATVSQATCPGLGPLQIGIRYQAASSSLDLSTEVTVARPLTDKVPTRLFIPIFSSASAAHVHQRFSGLEVIGGAAGCINSVARVKDTAASSLWLQAALAPDWRAQPLYQSIRIPRPLRELFSGDLR